MAVDVDIVLRNINIASPCSQEWSAMTGNDKTRFCHACQLNVYNFTKMTKSEIAELLNRESCSARVCVSIYRRFDGTVLTKDCPVGMRIIESARLGVRKTYAVIIACLSIACAILAGKLAFDYASNALQQAISQSFAKITSQLNGGMAPPQLSNGSRARN